MASSYSTSLGIEKIATGDQSGTWGDTSNYNWDIIDRISAYTSVALSDASTATLTVRESSPESGTENLQDGMYRVVKFTGSLSQSCTITISPNTSKMFFIVINATTDAGSSGPYSLAFTQGGGANVTVQNGNNAVIYCDGAGSGAVVADALNDLQIGNDLSLVSDSSVINMGADNDITITHVADVGLKLKQAGATGDGSPFVLTLQTGELDIAAADVLGQIDFQAPDENTGTDAILVAAGISAISEGDFSSSNNATKLSFKTASSAAAAETMSLSSGGNLTIAGDLTISGSALSVANGGTGASTFTDGGVLLGSGTGAVTAMAVLADSEMLVGDGTGDPVAESGATLRTSVGVGTGDSPTFAALTVTGIATFASGLASLPVGNDLVIGNTAIVPGTINGSTSEVQLNSIDKGILEIIRWQNASAGPAIHLGHSRGATVGADVIVQDADKLGTIRFGGNDGGDMQPVGASIQARVSGTPGVNDMPGELVFATTADGSQTPTDRLTIGPTGLATFANEVSMPNQPCFLAINSVTDSNVTGNGTVYDADFDTEIFDQGGDFASDVFTAPIAGRYMFSAAVRLGGVTTSGTNIYIKIDTSNRNYFFFAPESVLDPMSMEINVIADMDASDTAKISVNVSGEGSDVVDVYGSGSVNATYFSGCLVA
jgi:hypothetical protein